MIATHIEDKANAAFKKEERMRVGSKAMAEYVAARLAEDEKTERLKSLRLANIAMVLPVKVLPVKRKGRRS